MSEPTQPRVIPAQPGTVAEHYDGPAGGPSYYFRFPVQAWLLSAEHKLDQQGIAGEALIQDGAFLVTISQHILDLDEWTDSPYVVGMHAGAEQ